MTRSAHLTASIAVAVGLLAGCSTGGSPETRENSSRPTPTTVAGWTGAEVKRPERPGGGFGRSPITLFSDCNDLLAHLKVEARSRVTAWGLGGGEYYGPMPMLEGDGDMAAADSVGGAPAPDSAPEYSRTNTQEAEVDEGDLVETDGRFVYTAAGDRLRVVEVAGARLVAEPSLPEGDHQLLLDGDRLVVITQNLWSGTETVMSVFDVTDPNAPELLLRSHLEGRLVASRSTAGVVRLMVSTDLNQRLPFVNPTGFGLDEQSALRRNQEIIDNSTVQDWLPRLFDEAGDGSFGPMRPALDCATVAAPANFSGLGISWIASFDLSSAGPVAGSAGIVSTGETVYASPTALYVATVPWDWSNPDEIDGEIDRDGEIAPTSSTTPPTAIHAFSLGSGTSASYLASGEVPGTLLNQFAMSEHEGVLRVATTVHDWSWNGDGSESAVYMLRPQGTELTQISSVEGLGLGERIYAVRFMGPMAYVVTFREVDPLYVLDLTDPANPVLEGELKIPGYSSYLHPVGDGLLLGVGQDATETGRTTGTQLSLFDVSVPTDPQRIATLPIGGWSEVEWDHRAFLYWPADGTIVLPVSPGWGNCGAGNDCLASGLRAQTGGVVVARLEGRTLTGVGAISQPSTDGWGCWNPLRRSLVIGDELVTVGVDQMGFSDRTTLAERATVTWDRGDRGCGYWID